MTTRILLRIGIGVLALGAAAAAQGKKEQPTLGAVAKAAQEEKAKAGAAESKADSKTAAKTDASAKAGAANASATADASAAADENNAKATAGKRYTNEHLDGRPRPSSPSAYRTAMKGAAMVSSDGSGKDEMYWRQRAEPVRQRLEYSKDRLNSAKAQHERARTEGGLYVPPANGRTSTVQAERQRLATRVQDLEAEVRRAERDWTELEDEARRAGALPGWLR
jgi:hypothetical protein